MFNYESPIKAIYDDLQVQFEKEAIKAIQKAEFTVDKTELIKALKYDRQQYEKGYADAKSEIVYCYMCKNWTTDIFGQKMCERTFNRYPMKANDFCSYGERGIKFE